MLNKLTTKVELEEFDSNLPKINEKRTIFTISNTSQFNKSVNMKIFTV